MNIATRTAAFCITLTLLAVPGQAAEFKSVYTALNLDDCRQLTSEQEAEENQGAEWVCAGHEGGAVWVGEGDLRYFLGYGPHGRDQCSYGQTLGPFHSINTTIEWRLATKGGKATPIATILRYFIETDGQKAQYLVITRVSNHQACHMAYIDAAQPQANRLAREVTDNFADQFNCMKNTVFYYGVQGRSSNGPLGATSCPR